MDLLAHWTDYFVAQSGAAGALTGLLFVALSFNFDYIVRDAAWLGRAASGLILLAHLLSVGGLICLAVGLILAWVLLVEIRRVHP